MIIVSGLSGAGKTVALHTLEDLGYYCIDNLPVNLLHALYQEQLKIDMPMAVGIDIRSQPDGMKCLAETIERFKQQDKQTQVLFVSAQTNVLIKRFSETRRRHPLALNQLSLHEAIEKESEILSPLNVSADCHIDTSQLNIYDLKSRIANWLNLSNQQHLTITLESFGFKNGVPIDADLMLDVRFLPNPYWESELRPFNGKDTEIIEYLSKFDETKDFVDDTVDYLNKRLPIYMDSSRAYLTIAIGCTGGKHRSVYITEQLAEILSKVFGKIHTRHRDLVTTKPLL